MTHEPIMCRRCGLRVSDDQECEKIHNQLGDMLERAERLPENERGDALREHAILVERHKAENCHCPNRPWSLFTSEPQPIDLDWHDKHDR